MSFEIFLIKNNYRELISDLIAHGYSGEEIYKKIYNDYIDFLSKIRQEKIESILNT